MKEKREMIKDHGGQDRIVPETGVGVEFSSDERRNG